MARKKSFTSVINQMARQAAAESRRREKARIAETKRIERERLAQQKKAMAEVKRLEKQRQAQEKKRIAETERMRKVQEKKKLDEAKRLEKERQVQKKLEKNQYIVNKKNIANNRTDESQKLLESMDNILNHALLINNAIDWESLENTIEFDLPKPKKPMEPKKPTYQKIPLEPDQHDDKYKFDIAKPEKLIAPKKPIYQKIPSEPIRNDDKYTPKFGVFDFAKKRESKKQLALEKFENDRRDWEINKQEIVERNQELKLRHEIGLKANEDAYIKELEIWENKKKEFLADNKLSWLIQKQKIDKINQKLKLQYETELKAYEVTYIKELEKWENKKKEFFVEQDILNKEIQVRKENYFQSEPDAIHHYSKKILSNSKYYNEFPQEFELEYNPENKILLVDYQLPSADDIPTLKEVKYVQCRDEFREKHITKTELNKIYDHILYQITLRTIHELYEAHEVDAFEAIIFNGHVNSIDPATGKETNACVLSVQANKEDFAEINLAMVDPKACFKKLKGVGSSKLHSLTPIPPLVRLEREDSRFTDSYSVVDDIDGGYNLASMDWEDFENLIRELFEQAYAATGGEVKITQASRDGGIDAVIFDPDPLRGGKTVVQAKRYTNVVGVSAVRDLYGTLMNEGANKGILVTTSDYGPDAYKFAADKPIQLLNGGNLLHLLEQYGHKARIDLKEAKQIYSDKK